MQRLSKNKQTQLTKTLSSQELKKKKLKLLFIKLMQDEQFNLDHKKLIIKTFLIKFQKMKSKSVLTRRCIITNRNKVAIKRSRISRIKLKEMLDFGIVPGYHKAVW